MRQQIINNNSFLYKLSAVLTAAILTAGSVPMTAFAVTESKAQENAKNAEGEKKDGETEETVEEKPWSKITIGNEEEFLVFAQNCKLADYSDHLEVQLNSDLNLSWFDEDDFSGITSFSGIFRGNNHTVNGFKMEVGSETLGLFKYLEKDAVVRDLTVIGDISSTDSNNCLGGIVGINAGSIINCTFKGVITGTGVTGGIAGMNGADGSISRCTSEGMISSVHSVGGIVGENRGVVSDCTNDASVNSDESWLELESDSSISLSLESILHTVEENWQNGTDIGGIAGYSTGVIAGCVNKNTVGYKHFGKNVGGIAGRQSGEVIRCTNNGKVYGKQDVGGIVGQFEPWISLEEVEELDQAVDDLHDIMNKMVDDMSALSDDMHGDLDDLNSTSRQAGDTTDALLDEMRDVVKKNVDVVNELSSRLDYAISHFAVVMRYVNDSLDSMDLVVDDIKKVKDDLNIKEQMENESYDEAKTKRLVLQNGIGGVITSDNTNPAQDSSVTITISPERGYALDKLTYTPYQGDAVDVTAQVSDGKYVFAMPEENVTIAAVFRYIGEYIAESNEGGRVSVADSDGKVKIRIAPDGDYDIASVSVGGTNVPVATLTAEDNDIWTKELDRTESSAPILVKVVFQKKNNSYPVNIVTSAGGAAVSDKTAAAVGDTVTVTATPLTNYKIDSITMNGTDISGNKSGENGYTFTMPASEAKVKVIFAHETPSTDDVYAASNEGGSVSVVLVPTTTNYRVTIIPASGYMLADTGAVVNIANEGGAGNNVNLTKADLTESGDAYSYTLNVNNYTKPVKVFVTFTEKASTHSVNLTSGTGGVVAADSTQVSAGDKITIAVTNEPHYRLSRLVVNGEDYTSKVGNNTCDYEVPAGITQDVDILADFDPVLFVVTGEQAGGSAAYTVSGQEVTLTLTQNTGYKPVEPLSIKDADGSLINYSKQYEDSYIYKFDVSTGMKQLNPASLVVSYERQADKEAVDAAKDGIERQSDDLTSSADNMSNTADKIQDLLTDEYGEPRNTSDLTTGEMDELRDYLTDMAGYLADASVAAGGVLGNAVTIERIASPYLEDAADNVDTDLDKLTDDLDAMNDSLQNAGNEMQGIVDYFDALERLQAVNLSDNFDKNSDKLKEEMDTISDILDRMNDSFYAHSEVLEQDMKDVNDQLNKVFDLLIDKIDNIEAVTNGENVIEDHSADDLLTEDASRIAHCDNNGSVNGDRNAGGIVGNIGIEGTDSGDDDQGVSIGGKYYTRAILQNSTNNGFVIVKNENAGGIAGKMDLGYVLGCLGSGKISSETGSNLGGIAGESKGLIEKCSSLAVLSGTKYIGGIAGKADKIKDCYSMASIPSSEGFIGAIAGHDQAEDEDDITISRINMKDRISGNYYVSSKLYGINGVSYAGIAEPVSYTRLLAMDNVSNAFRHLQVVFTDSDNNVVKQTEIKFGESLENLEYPDLKTAQGDYMEWEGIDGDIAEGNIVIQAVETSNVTILSSEERFSTKSIALAEGVFTEAASIQVEEAEGILPTDLPSGSVCHIYQVKLLQTGLGEDDTTRIRILNTEGGKAVAYGMKDGRWQELDSKKMGSYIEMGMTGTEGTFCIAAYEPESPLWMYAVMGGCAVVILVLVGIIAKMKKKAKTGKAEK